MNPAPPLEIPQNCVRYLGNSKARNQDPWKIHIIFSCSPLEIPLRFYLTPGNLISSNPSPCLFFSGIVHYKRSDWKTWLSKRFPKALTSKLWNEKIYFAEAYRNGAKLNYIHPLWFYQKFLTDYRRGSHGKKIHWKNKVGSTTWAKQCGLIGHKQQNSSHSFSVNYVRQAGDQASKYLVSSFLFSDF